MSILRYKHLYPKITETIADIFRDRREVADELQVRLHEKWWSEATTTTTS